MIILDGGLRISALKEI